LRTGGGRSTFAGAVASGLLPGDAARLVVSAGLAIALGACGGPSGYRNGVYRDAEARFEVERPPTGWRAIRVGDEPDLAFHHAELDAVLQINASCDPSLDIPLLALTNQVLAGFTERRIQAQDTVPFDGREGLATHVQAKLDGVPRELLLLVAKKNGCVYDVILVAAPGERFVQARADYERLLATFHAPDDDASAAAVRRSPPRPGGGA